MTCNIHHCKWFAIATSLVVALSADQSFALDPAGDDPYVCPPCGHDCLKKTYENPGFCGECGMKLIKLSAVSTHRAKPHQDQSVRKKVAILLFDGVEIIDFTGPWEIFGSANFDVFSVSAEPGKITTVFGMQVTADYTLKNHPKPDIVVIPGGSVLQVQKNPQVLSWLRETAVKADVMLSVCNGAYILAKAGLLKGLRATTTRRLVDGLANAGEGITVVHDVRYVDNGKIVTAGGLSAGMDAALHVVSRFKGMDSAQRIAKSLEYNWQQE